MPLRHTTYAGLSATERAGADRGSTAFVFLHGLTFNRRMWEPVMDGLPSRRRAIALDLPGHGGSPSLAGRGLAPVVDAVRAAVEAAGVERPIVVGHSIGGPLASMYASAHPTSGAVSIEAPIRLEPFAEMLRAAAPALAGPGFAEVWAQMDASMRVELVPAQYRDLLRRDARPVQDLLLRYQADVLERPLAEVLEWRDERMAAVAAAGVPYLSLLAREPDPADVAWLTGLVPQAEVVVWPVEHHFPHLARPALFVDLLGELARRPAVPG
jgi:pimeloyl-ACP methyl ester carboxylesterase